MAQRVIAAIAKPDSLEFNPWDPHDVERMAIHVCIYIQNRCSFKIYNS